MREHATAAVLAGKRRAGRCPSAEACCPARCAVWWRRRPWQVAKRASREHYPAPWAIIDIWRSFGGNALAVPDAHPSSLASLVTHPTTASLQRVYHLRERLRAFGKGDGAELPAFARACDRRRRHGRRHRGLVRAARFDRSRCRTSGAERIAPAMQRATRAFFRKFRSDRRAARAALDRLIADVTGAGVRRADVIIEAIFEDLAAKQALFRDVEARAKPDALIATNTSSLRIEDIAARCRIRRG
jgi:3-hydroxyacyl-CoA dehydrogenase/enoyl-CoA hydratase/3-hydroxybutyryl-CoA epimerase